MGWRNGAASIFQGPQGQDGTMPDEIALNSQLKREHMADDLTNKGPEDRSRISLLEPHEVQYWGYKFNVSKERLSEAVRNVARTRRGRDPWGRE
jgi:predicted SPOUT superfamily RNA methylase MTH1